MFHETRFVTSYNIFGLGFLWLNVVGAVAVVLLAMMLEGLLPEKEQSDTVKS
jgi:hypothetical protein